MPAGRRAQPVNDVGKIVRIGRGFRQQPIGGRRFVECAGRQRLNDQADTPGERSLQPLDHHVEVVEGANFEQSDGAAFRRIRIDIIETLEVDGVFEFAERRQRVPPDRFACRRLRAGVTD